MREVTDLELIRHAAVISVDGWIFIGKCHGDCFHKAHHLSVKLSSKADDQGFVTNKGRYVGRLEAAELAFTNKQIDEPTSMLFSEDLWCPTYNGKYSYCEIKGYHLKEQKMYANWITGIYNEYDGIFKYHENEDYISLLEEIIKTKLGSHH